MQAILKKGATAAASLAVLLALGACGDRIENTEMPQPEQANVEINRQGMEGAKDEATAQGVANDTATMGAAPATAAEDPDVQIANEVKTTLATHPDFGAVKIDVHSDDGKVTLRGRAPDPSAKKRPPRSPAPCAT
ncbi:BON domain-containing protein [Ramlibacter terrae]|uniref:BON domain-containing protein n=1 Tax=Ramlibacter terrae TaxID=2732511 RepID=A0ABX6P3L9_9BURK|nr:BON domain-containing protein [Ramlibacter terrae]